MEWLFCHSKVILNQNDIGMNEMMLEWQGWKPFHPCLVPVEWPRNDNILIPPSFRDGLDENEWDGVDNFPYRESCQLRPWAWSHSTLIRGSSPLFLYFWMMPEWRDGARMTGMETRMTSWETSSSRRSWSSPVIPRPSLSFQWDEDQSHSKLIPSGNDTKMRTISF